MNKENLNIIDCGYVESRGFFSFFNQAIYGLYYSNINMIPAVIDFSHNNRYIDKSKITNNFWEYYFEQPFGVGLDKIDEYNNVNRQVWFIPNEVGNEFFLTPEHIAICGEIVKNYIRVKPHILQIIKDFQDKYMSNNKTILACHKRGTDHSMHGALLPLEYYFEKVDEKMVHFDLIYLATDEAKTLNAFKQRYGNRLINYDCTRSSTNTAIHFGVGQESPYKMGEDVLVDMLLMSKCDYLLKTYSNVTHSVLYFSPEMPFENIDAHIHYQ